MSEGLSSIGGADAGSAGLSAAAGGLGSGGFGSGGLGAGPSFSDSLGSLGIGGIGASGLSAFAPTASGLSPAIGTGTAPPGSTLAGLGLSPIGASGLSAFAPTMSGIGPGLSGGGLTGTPPLGSWSLPGPSSQEQIQAGFDEVQARLRDEQRAQAQAGLDRMREPPPWMGTDLAPPMPEPSLPAPPAPALPTFAQPGLGGPTGIGPGQAHGTGGLAEAGATALAGTRPVIDDLLDEAGKLGGRAWQGAQAALPGLARGALGTAGMAAGGAIGGTLGTIFGATPAEGPGTDASSSGPLGGPAGPFFADGTLRELPPAVTPEAVRESLAAAALPPAATPGTAPPAAVPGLLDPAPLAGQAVPLTPPTLSPGLLTPPATLTPPAALTPVPDGALAPLPGFTPAPALPRAEDLTPPAPLPGTETFAPPVLPPMAEGLTPPAPLPALPGLTPADPALTGPQVSLNQARGNLTGSLDELTAQERAFVEEQLSLGVSVDIIPRGAQRTADFRLNGVATELKTVRDVQRRDEDGLSAAIARNLLDARGQSGTVIIDAREQPGMTLAAAERAIRRALGRDDERSPRLRDITVLTPQGPAAFRR